MNLLTDCIRGDQEYSHLLRAIQQTKNQRSAEPIFITGLCEGAADTMYASLIEDLKKKDPRPTLILCPEECVRIRNF